MWNAFGIDFKSTHQRGAIRDTKDLIDRCDFPDRVIDLIVSVAVCSLCLIVEGIGHMRRNTNAHWSICFASQIIGEQRPDLKQCEGE
jgi:hypothetical protein